MSTDYSVVCLDCVEDFGWDGLSDQEAAIRIHKDAERFAEIYNLVDSCASEEIRISLEYHDDVDLRWFITHRSHTLVVMNEYQWFNLKYIQNAPPMDLHTPEPDPIFDEPVENRKSNHWELLKKFLGFGLSK